MRPPLPIGLGMRWRNRTVRNGLNGIILCSTDSKLRILRQPKRRSQLWRCDRSHHYQHIIMSRYMYDASSRHFQGNLDALKNIKWDLQLYVAWSAGRFHISVMELFGHQRKYSNRNLNSNTLKCDCHSFTFFSSSTNNPSPKLSFYVVRRRRQAFALSVTL